MELFTTMPMLLELRCTFCWTSATSVQRAFPPLVFGARLTTDTKRGFVGSVDRACIRQAQRCPRFLGLGGGRILGYEVERRLVWAGLGDAAAADGGLPITGMPEAQLRDQLELVEMRGHRDWVRVDIVLEIEAPDGAGPWEEQSAEVGGGGFSPTQC